MLALIFLALGLGGALAVYEFSPRAQARINDYARAIRQAYEAHRTADASLSKGNEAATIAAQHVQVVRASQPEVPVPLLEVTPPAPQPLEPFELGPSQARTEAHVVAAQAATGVATDHVALATEANQVAAENTAAAAKFAKTERERKAAAASAAKVLEREKKIEAALRNLGAGQCGVRSFSRVTAQIKDVLLGKLHAEGMDVTGDNPWNIDTHQYDVKLRAVWDPKEQVLKLIVTTGKGGYFGLVTCAEIWKKIDPILKGVIG